MNKTESFHTEQLIFCGFIAVILHALLLFGVGFGIDGQQRHKQDRAERQLEITIAHRNNQQKAEQADFLGMAAQEGSGDGNKATAPTITDQPLIEADEFMPVFKPEPPAGQLEQNWHNEFITTLKNPSFQVYQAPPKPEPATGAPELEEKPEPQPPIQAKSLRAALGPQPEWQAKATRIRSRHVSAAIHEARDVLYLDNWRRQIERIGNLNYPEEAKKGRVFGDLLLMVAIDQKGQLVDVRVERSSGIKILDDAAVRIVRLAAPFEPMTDDMKKDTDVLEIIRMWQFVPGSGFFQVNDGSKTR